MAIESPSFLSTITALLVASGVLAAPSASQEGLSSVQRVGYVLNEVNYCGIKGLFESCAGAYPALEYPRGNVFSFRDITLAKIICIFRLESFATPTYGPRLVGYYSQTIRIVLILRMRFSRKTGAKGGIP
jgi:hypothetical protein